ncbi:MAG: ATP-binding protein [Candidatus Aminicenantes bacterium]|nr:ATP-binding protein [Candidatus Aminicenantes bacterium]
MPTFRARARAVDLLGKGQIADLPTAICELWKNGYDAYADDLNCHLYLKGYKGINAPLFFLSDNGSGMNAEEVKDKWLILGTDSQKRGGQPPMFGKPKRIPMGEKGIGRLSVAYLGNRMLMLTKKQNEPCTAVFIHWEILENFYLYLDELNIPIKEFRDVDDFDPAFKYLLTGFEENLKKGNWDEHRALAEKIGNEINQIVSPDFIKSDILKAFLLPDSHGTFFIIFDPHEQLLLLSDENRVEISDDSNTNYLRSSLSGLYDGFRENRDVDVHFWLHENKGRYDLIARDFFFSENEIYKADHWLEGEFDSTGFFSGELQVFNTIVKHTYRPRRAPGDTPYGPFKIKFGSMEGVGKSSKLSQEQWLLMDKKLETYGGLYIYRDKFRVLPYGRIQNDFLGFEERRSKSATYYHFSHRRIFGFIEISRNHNPNLIDKAGREGFISNKAYWEFVKDLIGFFIDLSVRYFRTTPEGETPTLREQQAESIKKQNERILKLEKKRSKQTRAGFDRELKQNIERLDALDPELQELYEKLNQEARKPEIIYNNIESMLREITARKAEFKNLKIVKPRRVSITKPQENKLYYYNQKLDDSMIIMDKCDKLADELSKKLSKEFLLSEFHSKSAQLKKDIGQSVGNYRKRYSEAVKKLEQEIDADRQAFEDLFDEKTVNIIPTGTEEKEDLENRLALLEKTYVAVKEELEEKYDSFVKHVESLTFGIDDDSLVGWYKDQYEKIEEKVEAMQELAQLGMAIEIIDHQFNVLYSEMASAIDFFKSYADRNAEVKENFSQLKESFQHLESNHRLLTPLYRTTRRIKTEIWGKGIIEYMKKFFVNNLSKYRVSLTSDKSFDNYCFYAYESVIKPVFINIVDNAFYWLIPVNDRKIHLAYEDGKILVMNSGEPIDPAYREDIFNLFFTRKPAGRGIGLWLARTNLRAHGFDIYCTFEKKYNRLNGACFIIEPYDKTREKDEF